MPERDKEQTTSQPTTGDASRQEDEATETTNGSSGPINEPGSGGSADDAAGNLGRA